MPLFDISPPIYVIVDKLKCANGLMVPCDNLLRRATEEILDIICFHIQRSNMVISDFPGQGFCRLEVSYRHKDIVTYLCNGYHASH